MHQLNALTIDVEDYFQVSGFERTIARDDWDRFQLRVETNTLRLLELLDRHGVQATFFVLGWVADRCGRLVRRIDQAGHEIGCHSYWHRLVYQMQPAAFRHDLRRGREALEQLIGQAVTAYRAPSFSITQRSRWALEILAEEGFHSDSSIFPIHHDRYGMPDAPRGIHRIETSAGAIWEFPPTVLRVARLNLPVAGGGYFRLLPLQWTAAAIRRIRRRDQRPAMVYLHPWEVDPDQPRLKAGTILSRWRHYIGLKHTSRKLERLLDQFPFGRMCDVMAQFRDGHPSEAAAAPAQAVEQT